MVVIVVNSTTGEEIHREAHWEGQLPREGDVVEFHAGATQRWHVDEVDWVFEECPPDQHDEVPLRCAKVLVSPFDAGIHHAPRRVTEPGDRSETDPVCKCGHRQSQHSPIRCTGKGSTCDCTGFEAPG